MKKVIGMVALMVMGSGSAMAGCDAGTQIKNGGSALSGFLSGKLVDGTAVVGGEKWNEKHCSGGDLFKQGGTHASGYVEAPSKVGTWSVSGTGAASKVIYTYTRGATSSSYSFTLHDDSSGNYSFCNAVGGTVAVTATFSSAGC